MVIKKYETENKQYLYDASETLLMDELAYEYGANSSWFESFIEKIKTIFSDNKKNFHNALHIGSSTGRISFALADKFEKVGKLKY